MKKEKKELLKENIIQETDEKEINTEIDKEADARVNRQKKINKFLRGLGDGVYILTFVVCAYVFIMSYRGSIPSVCGYRFMRSIGESMEPTIKKGECIIIEQVSADKIKKNDVITFLSDDPSIYGFPNTHRVMDIKEDNAGKKEFVTKGDHNPVEDSVTAKGEKLLGRYIGDNILGKILTKMFEILSNSLVYFVVMILPIVIGLLNNIFDLIRIILDADEEELAS